MLAEILSGIVSAFVQVVSTEFLNKRRGGVSVIQLREEVIQLAKQQGSTADQVAETNRAVFVLIRLLTRGDMFEVRNDELFISKDWPDLDPAAVDSYLDNFGQGVRTAIEKSSRRTGKDRVPHPRQTEPIADAAMVDAALDDFFKDFDDEITAARRGQSQADN